MIVALLCLLLLPLSVECFRPLVGSCQGSVSAVNGRFLSRTYVFPNRAMEEPQKLLYEVVLLLKPGDGQIQNKKYHEQGLKRPFSDPLMWTHIFFVVGAALAAYRGLYDMALLTGITVPLSLAYHRSYEKPGLLTSIEGIAAKSLFVYGLFQVTQCPTPELFAVEGTLLVAVAVVFLSTNLNKAWYEPWHALMHVLPPIWSVFVALYHEPIVKIDMPF